MKEKQAIPSIELESAPFVINMEEAFQNNPPEAAPHAGDACPHCHTGRLDYDGMLNLACPVCGYAMGGCFT